MDRAQWEHNIATGRHEFVLSSDVRLSVNQVRDSLAAMQGINSPNPLYEVLVRAATDYMRMASNATATEQAERSRASAEEILRRAAESMQSDIFKRAFGGAYAGFDFSSKPDFTAFHRTFNDPPPQPRPKANQPRHWKEVLGFHVNQHVQKHEAKSAYRRKALEVQQKHNGDEPSMHEDMVALNVAKRQFEQEMGK